MCVGDFHIPTNPLIRYAVIVLVTTKIDVIICGHFHLYVILYLEVRFWQVIISPVCIST